MYIIRKLFDDIPFLTFKNRSSNLVHFPAMQTLSGMKTSIFPYLLKIEVFLRLSSQTLTREKGSVYGILMSSGARYYAKIVFSCCHHAWKRSSKST